MKGQMKRRVISMLMTICMVLGVMPAGAMKSPTSDRLESITRTKADEHGYVDFYIAPETAHALTIDGDINDWTLKPMEKKETAENASGVDTAEFGIKWDSQYLYIAAKAENIENGVVDNEMEGWPSTCFSLYFDPTMHRSQGVEISKNDLQIGLGYNANGDTPHIYFGTASSAAKEAVNAATIKQKKLAKNAWSVELRLPLSALGIQGTIGTSFGFNMSHEDNNVGSYINWAANGTFTFWDDTTGYGKVTLKEEGADIVPTEQIFDFRAVHPWWQNKGSYEGEDFLIDTTADTYEKVSDLVKKIDKVGLGKSASTMAKTAPWHYGGKSENAVFFDANAFCGLRLSPLGEWGSLVIRINGTGEYDLSSIVRVGSLQQQLEIFLAPKAEVDNGEDRIASKYLLRSVDVSQAPFDATFMDNLHEKDIIATDHMLIPLPSKTLNAGEYYVTYRLPPTLPDGKANAAQYQWVSAFIATPHVEILPGTLGNIEFTIPKQSDCKLWKGKSYDSEVTLYDADETDREISKQGAQIRYTASPEGILNVDQKTGKITALKRGLCYLTVEATLNGVTKSCVKKVTVSDETTPKELFYSYKKLGYSYSSGVDINTVTDFEMTTMGSEKEINKGNSPYCSYTDPWIFAGSKNASIFYVDGAYGCIMDGDVGGWAAFKIKVPTAGTYEVKSHNAMWAESGIMDIYFAPDSVQNVLSEDCYIGTLDNYATSVPAGKDQWNMRTKLRTMALEPGDYTIAYRFAGRNPKAVGMRFGVGGVVLTPTEDEETIVGMQRNITVGKDITQEVPLRKTLNGVTEDFANASDIQVKVSDSSILQAEVRRSEDRKNAVLVLKGLKHGETKIGVMVTVAGQTVKTESTIKVVDSELFDRLELRADTTELTAGSTTTTSISAYRFSGNAIDLSGKEIYYESGDPQVASVDTTGKITALNYGTTEIKAFVMIDDVAREAKLTIHVTTRTNLATANILMPGTVFVGSETPLQITGKYDSGFQYTLSDTATYQITSAVPSDCATIQNGKLLAKKSGTVTIMATVLGAGTQKEIVTEAKTIKIETQDVSVNKIVCNFRDDQSIDITSAKAEINGWGINRAMSDPKIFTDNQNLLGYKKSGLTTALSDYGKQTGGDLTLDVNIPADGAYSPVIDGGKDEYGTLADVYIDKQYVGQYDFHADKETVQGASAIMNTMQLTKGIHTITFRRVNQEEKNIYLGNITFNKVKKMPTFEAFSLSMNKTELSVREKTLVYAAARMSDGSPCNFGKSFEGYVEDPENKLQIINENPEVIQVEDHVVTGLKVGDATIKLIGKYKGKEETKSIAIHVSEAKLTLQLTADNTSLRPDDTKGQKIHVSVIGVGGAPIDTPNATISYKSLDERIIYVSDDGVVMPVTLGQVGVSVTLTYNGIKLSGTIVFHVTTGKTESSYYTTERVEAMRENYEKYPWAHDAAEKLIKNAEKYVGLADKMWDMVTTQELPRAITVGYRYDPGAYHCRYCGCDLRAKYDHYPWLLDQLNFAFKIQCPDCRRRFPSNDFESFYKLGIDEHGNWRYELAKQKNAELVAKGEQGYLVNTSYPEMDAKLGVTNWGVDDGYGYRTGKMIPGTDGQQQEETHTYIAFYNHYLWMDDGRTANQGFFDKAIKALTAAYLYTGDKRYGRTGAILVDRFADVFPDMEIAPYYPRFFNSDSTTPCGKMVGCEWQHPITIPHMQAYDAFYSMYEDPEVVKFLSSKGEQYTMENRKATPSDIRQNIEDKLLRETYKAVRNGDIWGNFGMHQSAVAFAAVILDNMPESKDMIDWIFISTPYDHAVGFDLPGGNVLGQIVSKVDRDGQGDESAPGYNLIWVERTKDIAEVLAGYKTYSAQDLYKNPKYIKMFTGILPLTLCRRATAQIGDGGTVGGTTISAWTDTLMKAFINTKNVEVAQLIYKANGDRVDGLHADVMVKNPEAVQDEIQKIIDTYGEYDFDQSQQLTGYGFGILRDGTYCPSTVKQQILDTQRDFWMYYGGAGYHRHWDTLNLGIEAYGLNMAPDFGYPEASDGSQRAIYRDKGAAIHNIVMIDRRNTIAVTPDKNGDVKHFDDSGRVKLMDVDMPYATSQTNTPDGIYRRSIVMVRVNDEISYGVDFFRVKGGDEQQYNFHAMSDEICDTAGLDMVKQPMGTLAGPDVPYGPKSGITNGFNFITNVRRDTAPGGEFSVDFKIKDFRKTLPNVMDLHLRMTMLNSFDLSEVIFASCEPPQHNHNPKSLEFVYARRKGKNLDTLFTTVFEPYNKERYIKNMSQVTAYRTGGAASGANDVVKAIKVELTNGNMDYIVYASNNEVQYRIDDKFDFMGFVGVYTEKNGKVIYSYGNDATLIGDVNGTDAYTGKVVDFTHGIATKNSITVSFNHPIDAQNLINRYIYIDNKSTINAAYKILGVSEQGGGKYVLDIGDITLVKKCISETDYDAGFSYNIAEGQSFRVPLPVSSDTTPILHKIEEKRVDAESKLHFVVRADSVSGKELSYSASNLPRGAQFDPQTHTFEWIPDAAQVGQNHVSFTVTDGDLSETQHVKIQVYPPAANGGNGPITNRPGTNTGNNNSSNNNSNNNNGNINNKETIKDTVDLTTQLDSKTNAATIEVKSDIITKVLNSEKSAIILNIAEHKKAESYEVKLPVNQLINSSMKKHIVVNTPMGKATLSTEMLANDAGMVTIKNGVISIIFKKTAAGCDVLVKANGNDYSWNNEVTPVDITFPFEKTEEMHDDNSIILKNAEGEILVNGLASNGKMSLRATKLPDSYTVEVNEKNFTDLERHEWASDAIHRLAARDIINGTSTMTYSPAANITRADFAVLIARTFRFTGEATNSFVDVKPGTYYAAQVATLKELGIIQGQNATHFNPMAEISRQDMAVILVRALGKRGFSLNGDTISTFTDEALISGYAKSAVNALSSKKILVGTDGKFFPQNKTTRAEVAVLLDHILYIN